MHLRTLFTAVVLSILLIHVNATFGDIGRGLKSLGRAFADRMTSLEGYQLLPKYDDILDRVEPFTASSAGIKAVVEGYKHRVPQDQDRAAMDMTSQMRAEDYMMRRLFLNGHAPVEHQVEGLVKLLVDTNGHKNPMMDFASPYLIVARQELAKVRPKKLKKKKISLDDELGGAKIIIEREDNFLRGLSELLDRLRQERRYGSDDPLDRLQHDRRYGSDDPLDSPRHEYGYLYASHHFKPMHQSDLGKPGNDLQEFVELRKKELEAAKKDYNAVLKKLKDVVFAEHLHIRFALPTHQEPQERAEMIFSTQD